MRYACRNVCWAIALFCVPIGSAWPLDVRVSDPPYSAYTDIAIVTASRSKNIVTVTTASPHFLAAGQKVNVSDVASTRIKMSAISREKDFLTIALTEDAPFVAGNEITVDGVTPAALNGRYTVAKMTDRRKFTCSSKGLEGTGTGGTAAQFRAIHGQAVVLSVPAPNQLTCEHAGSDVQGSGGNVALTPADRTARIQQAVDDVGKAGGGTVMIPADTSAWRIGAPIFVSWPNVTISGEGRTHLYGDWGASPMFVLGARAQIPDKPIGINHYPAITGQTPSVLDASVTAPRYGLRTFAEGVKASGYFYNCGFTIGKKCWADDTAFVLDLCIKNNGEGVMKGTLCGVGRGSDAGDSNDPLAIWALESDPATGENLKFVFRYRDPKGVEQPPQSLLISPAPLGSGVYRISVQLDFASGVCCAWVSKNDAAKLLLASKEKLPAGCRLKAFDYGALRLGRITVEPFSGSASDGTAASGDWTYCGLKVCNGLKYQAADKPGAAQAMLKGQSVDDNQRYFTRDAPALALLQLQEQIAQTVVKATNCTDGVTPLAYGFWMAERPSAPVGGKICITDLKFSNASCGPILIGEAQHVELKAIHVSYGCAQGFCSWGSPAAMYRLDLTNCGFMSTDALFVARSQYVFADNVTGTCGRVALRLVGCAGELREIMLANHCEYCYVQVLSGPKGGPLSISHVLVDNEGFLPPLRTGLYAEPSLDPGPGGNQLTVNGVWWGTMTPDKPMVELADPPGDPDPALKAHLILSGVAVTPKAANGRRNVDSVVQCSSAKWYGRIMDVYPDLPIEYGVIRYTGPENQCHLVSHMLVDGLPNTDRATANDAWHWYAGCHVMRMVDPVGATKSVEYHCNKTGQGADSGWAPTPLAK